MTSSATHIGSPPPGGVMAKFDAEQVATISAALSNAFDRGMDYAFVFAAVSAGAGLILAFLLDEEELRKVSA